MSMPSSKSAENVISIPTRNGESEEETIDEAPEKNDGQTGGEDKGCLIPVYPMRRLGFVFFILIVFFLACWRDGTLDLKFSFHHKCGWSLEKTSAGKMFVLKTLSPSKYFAPIEKQITVPVFRDHLLYNSIPFD